MNSIRVAEFATCVVGSIVCVVSFAASEVSILYTIFWVGTIPCMIVFALLYFRIRERVIKTEEDSMAASLGALEETMFYVPSFHREADVIPTLNFLASSDYSDENCTRMSDIFKFSGDPLPS